FECAELFVQRKYDPDRLRRKVLNPLEIQQQLTTILCINQAIQLLADVFQHQRIHQRRRAKLDDGILLERMDGEVWIHGRSASPKKPTTELDRLPACRSGVTSNYQ